MRRVVPPAASIMHALAFLDVLLRRFEFSRLMFLRRLLVLLLLSCMLQKILHIGCRLGHRSGDADILVILTAIVVLVASLVALAAAARLEFATATVQGTTLILGMLKRLAKSLVILTAVLVCVACGVALAGLPVVVATAAAIFDTPSSFGDGHAERTLRLLL
jgi:hypothetical protein